MATVNLGKIKLKWRGTWSSGGSYTADDVVEYTDGSVTSSYIAVASSSNQTPSSGGTVNSSYWNYAAKGQNASPTTTQGDIIVRGASADERLAIGAAGKALKVNSSANGLEYGDAGAWTKLASGSGAGTSAISIDNIFSNTYDYYKLFYTWAQDDWMKFQYIKDDGTAETGGNYTWTGVYSHENSDGEGRYGNNGQTFGVYNYWNATDDAPAVVEITFYHPYKSDYETTDFYHCTMTEGARLYYHAGSNTYTSAGSHRGVKLFANGGDSISAANFKYLVLGIAL